MVQASLTIECGDKDRPSGPIQIQSPFTLSQSCSIYVKDKTTNVQYPAYLEKDPSNQDVLWILLPSIKKGISLDLMLDSEEKIETLGTPEIVKIDENTLQINIENKEFTRFNFNLFEKANRPCLYPVYSPDGIGATRNFPWKTVEGETTDHIHHTGVWTAWGNINGCDNWAFGKDKGRQEVIDVSYSTNPVFAQINLTINWVKSNGIVQLKENRIIRIYNSHDSRIVDFHIALTAVSKKIKFGDTKEGGFLSVRVPTPMDVPQGGKIENARGGISEDNTSEKLIWGKQAEWCDYSGLVGGKKIGIAILDNKHNITFPTYWHVRNYGLMTANPFGISYFKSKLRNGSYKIKKDESLIFDYRLIVHDGDAQEGNIEGHYQNYVEPLNTNLI